MVIVLNGAQVPDVLEPFIREPLQSSQFQEQFEQKVAEETYRDVLGSDILSTYSSIRNTDLKRLVGVQPNEMRVFSRLSKPAVASDGIDITLCLAMLNLEAYLAGEAGVRDMVRFRLWVVGNLGQFW